MHRHGILLLSVLLFSGSCYILINPTNVTTCLNSSVNFTCAINDQKAIFWMINGQSPQVYYIESPSTSYNMYGHGGAQSTLTVPGSYEFDGANVTCYYISKFYNSSGFL